MGKSKGEFYTKGIPARLVNRTSQLPMLERLFYWVFGCLGVLYLGYEVYIASIRHYGDLNDYFMSKGWSFINRKKDDSNFEWDFWGYWFPYLILGCSTHVIFGQICGYWSLSKWRKYIFLVVDLSAAVFLLGPTSVCMLIFHSVLIYIVAWTTGSSRNVWLISLVLLSSLNFESTLDNIKAAIPDDPYERRFFLVVLVTALCNLRYTSFALEMVWYYNKKEAKDNSANTQPVTDSKEDNKDSNPSLETSVTKLKAAESEPLRDKSASPKSAKSASPRGGAQSASPRSAKSASPRNTRSRFREQPQLSPRQQKQSEHRSIRQTAESSELQATEAESSHRKKQPGTKAECFSFLDMLQYMFYLPLFCTGPVFTYEQYKDQFNKPVALQTFQWYKWWLLSTFRVIFWLLISELSLHFLYFNAIMHSSFILDKLPLSTLGGVMVYNGLFFGLKYLVFYGLSAQVAQLDQLYPPKGPTCVFRIYKFSQMWKSFDRGLYQFMKRYIYVPLGGSQHGIPRQLFASSMTFLYIYVWHGTSLYIFVWAAINYTAIIIEVIVQTLSKTTMFCNFKSKYVSDNMYNRLVAVIITPMYLSSLIGLSYFLGGMEVGDIYVQKFFMDVGGFFRACCLLYLFVQVSRESEKYIAAS